MLATSTDIPLDVSYLRDLSDEDLELLRSYTVSCYSGINTPLRAGEPLHDYYHNLHTKMQEVARPLESPLTLWRGILISHHSRHKDTHPHHNDVWQDRAWVSCSLSENMGKDKAGHSAYEVISAESFLLKLEVPAGTPVVPVYHILKEIHRRSNSLHEPPFIEEEEVVLAPNLTYRVIERKAENIIHTMNGDVMTVQVS